jgi:integrase
MPASTDVLADFVTYLIDTPSRHSGTDLGPASIDQHVAAIRAAHTQLSYPGTPDPAATRAMRDGRRRNYGDDHYTRSAGAEPFTLAEIQAMSQLCEPAFDQHGHARIVGSATATEGGYPVAAGSLYRLVHLLSIATMGRRPSALLALDIDDIRLEEEYFVIDTGYEAGRVPTAEAVLRVSSGNHPLTCPVTAMRVWLNTLASAGIADGPLLRSVGRGGTIATSFRMAPSTLDMIVQRLADGADIRRPVNARTLRHTGGILAYEAGASVAEICDKGEWSSAALARLVFRRAKQYRHPMTGSGL